MAARIRHLGGLPGCHLGNPAPDQEVVSFDFVSRITTTAAPLLCAVTVE